MIFGHIDLEGQRRSVRILVLLGRSRSEIRRPEIRRNRRRECSIDNPGDERGEHDLQKSSDLMPSATSRVPGSLRNSNSLSRMKIA